MRKDLEAKKRQLLSVKEEAMVSGNNSLVRNLKAKINILLEGIQDMESVIKSFMVEQGTQ